MLNTFIQIGSIQEGILEKDRKRLIWDRLIDKILSMLLKYKNVVKA